MVYLTPFDSGARGGYWGVGNCAAYGCGCVADAGLHDGFRCSAAAAAAAAATTTTTPGS